MKNINPGPAPKISAVMPCLNEEETVGVCVEKAFRAFEMMGVDGEVVIGDNGSTDESREIAEKLGARVVVERRRGYGSALTAAIEAARGKYIIMADADDSYDWLGIEPLYRKLENGADVVIGNRFSGGIKPGAMPFLHRYIGNPVLSFLARTISKAPVGDFHCGMRGFTKEAYRRMGLRTPGMEFATEMIIRAARAGLKIEEAPVVLYPDKRSRPPHLRTFHDGWRHLRFIMTYGPNYLYMIPGAALFLAGTALQLLLYKGSVVISGFYMGVHFLALGCLMTLVGFNVINLGVLAKVMMSIQAPDARDRLVGWLLKNFSLETGLIAGGALLAAGGAIDVALLWKWLAYDAPMEGSVHIAFVATSAIAVGVSVVFSSFLIGMLLQEARDRAPEGSGADG
ncbi:MAG: glycosyltransferase family 2 protein [Candidatus Nitrospinota bacterium M3_3B_026]